MHLMAACSFGRQANNFWIAMLSPFPPKLLKTSIAISPDTGRYLDLIMTTSDSKHNSHPLSSKLHVNTIILPAAKSPLIELQVRDPSCT